MESISFEPSTVLSHVKFGLMGYLPLSKVQFEKWRIDDQTGLVSWSDGEQVLTPTVREFQIVENFLPNKMLFVGNSESKREYLALRGELIKRVAVQCNFDQTSTSAPTNSWSWAAVFVFYEKYEALVILLHTEISSISVDHLVFLREQVWYPRSKQKSWTLAIDSEQKAIDSFHDLFNHFLSKSGLHSPKIDSDYPLFSLMELRSVGPAVEVMNYPAHAVNLSVGEHYGLFSGDEGYRLVNLDKSGPSRTVNTGYALSLFDPQYQFSGRKHFAYHFSSTNCICFTAEDVATQKKQWANWYVSNVVEMSTVSDYVGLASNVPCLSDGIPIMVEVCMIRYRHLINIERELRQAFERGIAKRILMRLLWPKTALDVAQRRVEQLDLYQDNALWIIGGPHTDLMFDYAAVRARLDRARQSIQQIESETTRVPLAAIGLLLTTISLALAVYLGVGRNSPNCCNITQSVNKIEKSDDRPNPLVVLPLHLPVSSDVPSPPISSSSSMKGK